MSDNGLTVLMEDVVRDRVRTALTVQDVKGQVQLIQQVLREVMKDGEHFGVIPGTGAKKTLLKAGAEKLCLTFRLDPEYESVREYDGEHLTVTTTCTLWHIDSGLRLGSGMGICSTKESKYAWRQASKKCPECAKETIIKGKAEYGGGWLCFAKKGGCGAKFRDGDASIESQPTGRSPNPDIPDTYNTVLKMACKRALVAGVLNATAASDIFTQDLEDTVQAEPVGNSPPVTPPPPKAEKPAPPPPLKETVKAMTLEQQIATKDAWLVKQGLIKPGELRAYVLRQPGCSVPGFFEGATEEGKQLALKHALEYTRGRFIQECEMHMERCDIGKMDDALGLAELPAGLTAGTMDLPQFITLLGCLRELESAPFASDEGVPVE